MDIVRQIVFSETGDPSVLFAQDADLKQPAIGEIRVHVEACGVEAEDIKWRNGDTSTSEPFPRGIGINAIGTVAVCGPGVQDHKVGSRVACIGVRHGSYATEINFPAHQAIEIPSNLSATDAAATIYKALTVEYLINRCVKVIAGQNVLWQQAADPLGRLAISWLAYRGVNVIGTVIDEDQRQRLLDCGCTEVVAVGAQDAAARIRAITGGMGVDFAFDGNGRDTFDLSLTSLKTRGTLVQYGQSSGPAPDLDISRLRDGGSLTLTCPRLPDYIAQDVQRHTASAAVFNALTQGHISPGKITCFALEQAKDAHFLAQSNGFTDSSVVLMTKGQKQQGAMQ